MYVAPLKERIHKLSLSLQNTDMHYVCVHTVVQMSSYFSCFFYSVNNHRPRLRPDGSAGSDYINASFVDVRLHDFVVCDCLCIFLFLCISVY